MNNSRINFDIEMLRGIAIVMVLFQHYPSLYFWSDHATFQWVSQYFTFWPGVDLFFCISGFVVGKTLIDKLDKNKDRGISTSPIIKDFFIKRIFRLLPTTIAWVLIVLFLSKHFNTSGAFGIFEENLKQAASVLTYNYNLYVKHVNESGIPPTFAPFWSLNLEEQFYFIFPFFLLFCKKNMRLPVLITIISILFFIKRQGHLSFNFRIDAISYGVILSILSSRDSYAFMKNKMKSRLNMPNALLIFMILLLIIIPKMIWESSAMVGILAIICFITIYLASFNEQIITLPQPIRKILIYIGSRSYGLYLIHMPSIFITQEVFAQYFTSQRKLPHGGVLIDISITALSLLVTIILVETNYHLIENPFRKIGRQIASKKNKESVTSFQAQ